MDLTTLDTATLLKGAEHNLSRVSLVVQLLSVSGDIPADIADKMTARLEEAAQAYRIVAERAV